MYAPHRIDLDWPHWLTALAGCRPGSEEVLRRRIEPGGAGNRMVFLSVRSAFDALLQAQNWPAGDEILFTALTIDDMPRIARAHGLVPVAVDVDPRTLAADPAALAGLCTPRTRAVVAAQLFGGRSDLAALAAAARARGLVVIEDAAQSFAGPHDTGDAQADVTLQSFGTLKTATALGGCLAYVRQPELMARMAGVQASWPPQKERAYAAKVAKAALLLAVQTRAGYSALAWLCQRAGRDVGSVVRRMTRGFGHADDRIFLGALRQRPCAGLLRFLAVRLAGFSPCRLHARAAAGELLMAALAEPNRIGDLQRQRTHWLVPVAAKDAVALGKALASAGFDASGASNVVAVGGERAPDLMRRLVFVPAYPEMPAADRRALADAIARIEKGSPC